MSNATKLAEILSRSKAVMQKTDENHGSTIKNTQGGNYFSSEEKYIGLYSAFILKNKNTSPPSS